MVMKRKKWRHRWMVIPRAAVTSRTAIRKPFPGRNECLHDCAAVLLQVIFRRRQPRRHG
jgi:hypothetical protein